MLETEPHSWLWSGTWSQNGSTSRLLHNRDFRRPRRLTFVCFGARLTWRKIKSFNCAALQDFANLIGLNGSNYDSQTSHFAGLANHLPFYSHFSLFLLSDTAWIQNLGSVFFLLPQSYTRLLLPLPTRKNDPIHDSKLRYVLNHEVCAVLNGKEMVSQASRWKSLKVTKGL